MRTCYILIFLALSLLSCKEEKSKTTDVKEDKKVERNQVNILNWEQTWVEGEGSLPGYKSYGNENESKRIQGLNPDGKKSMLWQCIPDTKTDWDGGFMIAPFEVDKSHPYMFVAWVKKTGANQGKVYYAVNSVQEVTGEPVKNANFIGAGSTLKNLDQWYTLVGYIYPNNYVDDIEADVISGLYLNGEKIQEGRDYKWDTNEDKTSLRVVQVKCGDNPDERLLIWNPQLYKVDGTEPKLYSLL